MVTRRSFARAQVERVTVRAALFATHSLPPANESRSGSAPVATCAAHAVVLVEPDQTTPSGSDRHPDEPIGRPRRR